MEQSLVTDRLFIQEIINDIAKQRNSGFHPNLVKSHTMLRDWSAELREKTHMRGRTKKIFFQKVGKENW